MTLALLNKRDSAFGDVELSGDVLLQHLAFLEESTDIQVEEMGAGFLG